MGKKGKYDDIIDSLPRGFGTDPDFREKVDAVKKSILECTDGEDFPSEAVEDMILEITSLQKALNDALLKAVNGKRHANHLARLYTDLRRLKKSFEQQEKVTNVTLEAFEQIMIDQYEVEGIKSLQLENGDTIRINYEPKAKVIDKEEFRLWCIENGLETSLQLWPSTMNALTKERLLQGEPEPDGVLAESVTKVTFTPA